MISLNAAYQKNNMFGVISNASLSANKGAASFICSLQLKILMNVKTTQIQIQKRFQCR